MNPTAIAFFISGASFGYVFGDWKGAALGLAITSLLCVMVTQLGGKKR